MYSKQRYNRMPLHSVPTLKHTHTQFAIKIALCMICIPVSFSGDLAALRCMYCEYIYEHAYTRRIKRERGISAAGKCELSIGRGRVEKNSVAKCVYGKGNVPLVTCS